MNRLSSVFFLIAILHLGADVADAVQITIVARDFKGRPVKDVRFSPFAGGALSAPTTSEGRTKIILTNGFNTGESVEIQVSRVRDKQPDWVFISPWDGWVTVPKTGGYCKVVLARRGDREALESGDGARAMTESIVKEFNRQKTPQQPMTEEQRKQIIEEQAARIGLPVAEIDQVIRAWKERAQDPYDIGIAALYERNYPKAEVQLEKSLEVRRKQEAESREKYAAAAYFLGQAQYEQGHYTQAAESFHETLERRPADTLTMNSYGVALASAGKYNEAELLLKRSLVIREKALGKEHPDVANSLNNLAGLYRDQGRYAEAEPLFKRSLEICEKALGKEHSHVATVLNNLAALYRDQGKYAEAEPLFERSLEICEKALGKEHPDMANSLNNLAKLYLEQGKYAEAEPLFKRSLEIREKALGKEHPAFATCLINLAGLYQEQGMYAEAEPLLKRSLEIYEKALGKDHRNVATVLNNLAALYCDQGRYAEAEPLYTRSLEIREKALGREHPAVATALINLAILYDAQGRYAEAEQLYQRALQIATMKLGDDHPTTRKIQSNLEGHAKAMLKNNQ